MLWKPSTTSDDFLMHYAKGSHAKKHKYIAIKNGRYIYPDDKTNAYKEAQKKAVAHEPNRSYHQLFESGQNKYKKGEGDENPNLYVSPSDNSLWPFNENTSKTKLRQELQKYDPMQASASKNPTKYRVTAAKHEQFMALSNARAKRNHEKTFGKFTEGAKYTSAERRKDAEQYQRWHTAQKSAENRLKQKQKIRDKAEKKSIDSINNIVSSNRSPVVSRKLSSSQKAIMKGKQIFNSLKYKIKKKIGSGKTTYTVTDVSTGKSRNVTPTSSSSKNTINVKKLTEKNKKKRR